MQACQANVTRCVKKLEGVEDVNVNLLANSMAVSYDESRLKPENIINAVQAAGYNASNMEKELKQAEGFKGEWLSRKERAESERQGMKKRLLYSVILLVPLMYIAMGDMLSAACSVHINRNAERADFGFGSIDFNRTYNFYQ